MGEYRDGVRFCAAPRHLNSAGNGTPPGYPPRYPTPARSRGPAGRSALPESGLRFFRTDPAATPVLFINGADMVEAGKHKKVKHPVATPGGDDSTLLAGLVLENEQWLMARILSYAKERNYTQYTSTLPEAWRLSISGLSRSLVSALENGNTDLELTPDKDYTRDPIADFGIVEARRHRERGVALGMFLGLKKYYHQSYVDLLDRSAFEPARRGRCRTLLDRFFDRVEIGFCTEWAALGEDRHMEELRSLNRLMTNEKNKYLTVFESQSHPTFLLDRENRIDNLNPAAAGLLKRAGTPGRQYYCAREKRHAGGGQSSGNRAGSCLLGAKAEELLPWIADELKSFSENRLPVSRFEKRFTHGNCPRYFDVKLSRMQDVSDKFAGTVVVLDDLTERKMAGEALAAANERLNVTLHSIGDGVVTTDSDGRVVLLNKVSEELTGWTQEEAEGKLLDEVFHIVNEHTRQRCENPVRKVLDTGTIVGLANHTVLISRNGTEKIIADSGAPILDRDGGISGVVLVFRDITERIKTEINLRQAQKMEAIGTLAGGIAHDFNNILSPIMGYAEMALIELPEESAVRSNLSGILAAAGRARDLVQQILTFARQKEKNLGPLRIPPVLKEVLKLVRSSMPATIEIDQDVDDRCGCVVADATQIQQVAMNLLTNAYHAIPAEGGRIQVKLATIGIGPDDLKELDMVPGTYACLTVADTGSGIDPSVINRIFDPYFSTKDPNKGTGLGLSVVQGIVKSYGGRIGVCSEPGRGAVFTVYLPCVSADGKKRESFSSEPAPGGTERILLVDDEDAVAEMGKQMLEKLGYHVTATSGGKDALKVFRPDPGFFDLVITDATMPKMTGIELARKMMEIRPDIPIIICTGFSEQISEAKARAAGIREYVMKPVIRSELAKTIRRVLDGKCA